MIRSHRLIVEAALVVALVVLLWVVLHRRTPSAPVTEVVAAPVGSAKVAADDEDAPTVLYAHNLRLRHGASFKVSIRWVRGLMVRTRAEVHASFDDPDSFVMEIDKGVVRVALADIVTFLSSGDNHGVPLTGITIEADGETLKVHGTVHKLVSLPTELVGVLSPLPDGRVKFSVSKIDVLKIPLKGLLGGLHLQLADLVRKGGTAGLTIVGNDVIFNTEMLLPPPHVRGQISSMHLVGQEIEVVYGGARNDESKLSQWHNFLKLTGGTIDSESAGEWDDADYAAGGAGGVYAGGRDTEGERGHLAGVVEGSEGGGAGG